MRIANAIVDLRRPPSPSTSFSLPQNSPQNQQYALAYSTSQSSQPYTHSPHFNGHSRTQSQSHSQQSYNGHNSMQSSVGAPLNGYLAQTYGTAASGLMSPESAPHTGDLLGSPMRENFGSGVPMGEQANGPRSKGRPAQLNLSPSDGALNVSATQTTEVEAHEDERAVMSEVNFIRFFGYFFSSPSFFRVNFRTQRLPSVGESSGHARPPARRTLQQQRTRGGIKTRWRAAILRTLTHPRSRPRPRARPRARRRRRRAISLPGLGGMRAARRASTSTTPRREATRD